MFIITLIFFLNCVSGLV